MHDSALLEHPHQTAHERSPLQSAISQIISHAAHLLPTQGPITVFVHHNTLHALEDLSFHDAVVRGTAVFGCEPYLPEDDYRRELARGRILRQDLAAVLVEDLGENAGAFVEGLGTRYHLRLSMLEYPLRLGPDAELRWLIAETNALTQFRDAAPAASREQMLDRTRRWIMRDLRNGASSFEHHSQDSIEDLLDQFGKSSIERWSTAKWEAFTLHILWRVCLHGVHGVPRFAPPGPPPVRHRDLLLQATGKDADQSVNEVLIKFCAAFLDQGLAPWPLPERDAGFFRAFIHLYRDSRPVDLWLRRLPAELRRIEAAKMGPLESIEESLRILGVTEPDQEDYITQSLLALRGWAGMLWQMETNAEWTVHPAPAGTLVEYLAVRLLLTRLAVARLAYESGLDAGSLRDLRTQLRRNLAHAPRVSVEQRAFVVFQLAQVLGWDPELLRRSSKQEWSKLVEEIEAFSDVERRRIYHLAYERRYRNQTLDALSIHGRSPQAPPEKPDFQVICCLDEREESYRRHLEEVAPNCETLSLAGFYGVAMYYQGAGDAHYKPLCPVIIKPRHYVRESVVESLEDSHRRRAFVRRAVGKATLGLHVGSRSIVGGVFTAILGSLSSLPLVLRVLFPRLTAQLRRACGSFVQPPPLTRLVVERTAESPGPQPGQVGYLLDEMAAIVERMLRDAGLVSRFGRLVIVTGHGSSSLNNPHEPAHDCGACGGARGGPNARAFAQMANDPRIRERLVGQGIAVPVETIFVGAYHNTCDESVTYFDLERLPASHRQDFDKARAAIDEARRRNAHERCRRFESAELSITPEAALRHVEGRAADLSQVRPEYGHATNAICLVGRRARSLGLFCDRRNFLTSYDPTVDDEEHTVLTRVLQAAIPVCAGISLEYYFSFVDPTGYGCGTKLPHNIVSLLGVMNGAASDLRPGLPWQMVEIHEPVRCLFVIETTPEAMLKIMERNPAIGRLCRNDWVQLATLDPDSPAIQLFQQGRFEPYTPESATLPVVASSVDWYRGWRDHLGYAVVKREKPRP